jgi:hypothetical protein
MLAKPLLVIVVSAINPHVRAVCWPVQTPVPVTTVGRECPVPDEGWV